MNTVFLCLNTWIACFRKMWRPRPSLVHDQDARCSFSPLSVARFCQILSMVSDLNFGFSNDAKYPSCSFLLEPLNFDSTFPLNAQDAFENVSFQIACLRGGIITLHLSFPHCGYLNVSPNHLPERMHSSGETLCRDNCQLIGMPYFHTRSAGKNNRN